MELPRAVRTGRQEEMSNSAVVAQKNPLGLRIGWQVKITTDDIDDMPGSWMSIGLNPAARMLPTPTPLRRPRPRACRSRPQDLPVVLVVLDHQNALVHACATCFSTITGSVTENVDPCPGLDFREMLPPLGRARDVAARPIWAGHQAKSDRITAHLEDDRNGRGRRLCRKRRRSGGRGNHGHLTMNQISRQRRQPIDLIVRPAVSIATF